MARTGNDHEPGVCVASLFQPRSKKGGDGGLADSLAAPFIHLVVDDLLPEPVIMMMAGEGAPDEAGLRRLAQRIPEGAGILTSSPTRRSRSIRTGRGG